MFRVPAEEEAGACSAQSRPSRGGCTLAGLSDNRAPPQVAPRLTSCSALSQEEHFDSAHSKQFWNGSDPSCLCVCACAHTRVCVCVHARERALTHACPHHWPPCTSALLCRTSHNEKTIMIKTLNALLEVGGKELLAQPSTSILLQTRMAGPCQRMNEEEQDLGRKEHPSFATQEPAKAPTWRSRPKLAAHTSYALLELKHSQPVLCRRQTYC